ncbi:MAG: hypothetical protein ACRD1B_06945, partial [Thermoanaerobaculia bacterium]
MPRRTLFALLAALLAVASGATAAIAETSARPRIVRPAAANAVAAVFSTEVPLIQRYVPPGGGSSTTLVLNAAHSFNVSLVATNWHVPGNVTGPGIALPQNDLFGYFSLPALTSNASNPEVFVKILDGRPINGKYWVFYGHLTDLIYDLTVRENATGITKIYHKDAGNAVGGFDTGAFSATATSNLEDAQAAPLTPNAFVRTAIDISNNTNSTITANLQYSYTCTAPTCPIVNAFFRTSATSPQATISILGFGSFHQDDMVQYLGNQGLLQTGADQGSNGTLLLTFNNVPSNIGWEATVEARTYNRVLEPDALRGTVGFGMNGSLFFESTNSSLTGTVRDTRSAPTLEGSLTSHVGIRNTDIFATNIPVSVDLSLYDPAIGQRVGNIVGLNNLLAGEVRVVNDIFTAAGVPGTKSLILFADVRNRTSSSPTIEGFILVQDTYSGDIRAHE